MVPLLGNALESIKFETEMEFLRISRVDKNQRILFNSHKEGFIGPELDLLLLNEGIMFDL